MELINEFKLLVILGAWNVNIFSKEWIKKYLFTQDDFDFELEFNLTGSHRISSDKIRIEFHNDKLNFITRNKNVDTYNMISELALKIADYLPHTPVIAFGVNYLFECNPDDIQSELIKTNDVDKLNEYGSHVLTSKHIHATKLKDKFINITICYDENRKLLFDFNFHFDISNLTQMKEKIYESPIIQLKQIAADIMKDVYQIQCDGE